MLDSAFKLGSRNFLAKSPQDVGDRDYDDILVNTAIASMKQLSECGMRMIQSQSPG